MLSEPTGLKQTQNIAAIANVILMQQQMLEHKQRQRVLTRMNDLRG